MTPRPGPWRRGEDGTYAIGSGETYLSLAGDQAFASFAASLSIEPRGGGYTIGNGQAYVAVSHSNGHVIVPADADGASTVYLAEVLEEQADPETPDTEVQIPALLPDEGFSAIITSLREKSLPSGYTIEIEDPALKKLAELPDAPGFYLVYITGGDYAGYALPMSGGPIKVTLEEAAQSSTGVCSSYFEERMIQEISSIFEMGSDGTTYLKGDGEGLYAKIVMDSEYPDFPQYDDAPMDEATTLEIYEYVPTVIKNIPVTSATVKKVWDDDNDRTGTRPDSITVTLSDGTEVELSADNGWTATVDGLPKYDGDGKEIAYAWTEKPVSGYKLSDTKVEGQVTTLTNTVVPSEPGEPEAPSQPEEPKVRPAQTRVQPTATPRTGDGTGALTALLLVAGLSCAAVGGAIRRRLGE